MNKKVVVNFGHGLKNNGVYDPGAIGPTRYQEATQTKEVGTLVVDKLKANGWQVLEIQDGDLWDVTNQANAWKPDYFLSIHSNSFTSASAHGIESIILAPGGMAEKIAREVQKELVKATGLYDRGVKFNNLHVLRETIGYPAALFEIGFISNPKEEALMKQDSFDEAVASAICRGFSRAIGVLYEEPKEGGKGLVDLIIVGRGPDERAAGYLADYLQAPVSYRDAVKLQDIEAAKNVYVVGGKETPVERAVLISGSDRYDTCQAVLDFIKNGGK